MNKPPLFKIYLLLICLLGCVLSTNAQQTEAHRHQASGALASGQFYATADAKHALALKKELPNDIFILATKYGVSAIKLTEKGAHELHHKVLVHGPGYVYKNSLASALEALNNPVSKAKQQRKTVAFNYTIDQDAKVLQSLGMVNNINVQNTILDLVSYGTRYHTKSSATQSAIDLKAKWEALAVGRSDISVRLVNHTSSNMPSVVMTIQGAENPDEFVIIGGHLDSTNPSNNNNAPGADDDASGIATITEAARVLIDMNYKPKRTIEFMAYAAEEVGLRGSNEIAQDYKNRNVNVISYVQFDMTNYNGSSNDVYIVNDSYTDNALNTFLTQLMDHYNASGVHKLTYGTTKCNYGCSDHYSWAQKGYDAAFPLEASFQGSNPHIHTANDTYQNFPTANSVHAQKFVKLALEFLIEVSKSSDVNNNCAIPSNLNASSIGNTSATLSWSGNANSYNIRYRAQGSSNWTALNTSNTSASISNLLQGTGYEFQVRGVCTAGNSSYSASANFTTTGTPTCNGITVFPYTESFESGTGVWTQGNSDNIDWSRDNNGTPSNNTGPSSAADGNYYMYIEASSPNYPSKTADLLSPCIKLSDLSAPQLSFKYHMYGAAMGTLKVQISTNGGSSWTDLWSKSGNQGNNWSTANIDLPTSSSVITLRFRGITGNNYTSDITIDELRIGEKTVAPLNYCASKGNTVSDEWIGRVRVGSIDNSSNNSNGGYSDFTAQSTNLSKGSSTNITINPAWSGQTYSEGYAVWIDYNQNGVFTDSGELVFSQSSTSSSQVSGSFTVPAGAVTGSTRMRVSMKYNATPTACESFTYGEVEDYTVNIGGSSFAKQTALANYVEDNRVLDQLENTTSRFAPNPTSGFTSIAVGKEMFEVKVFDLYGVELKNIAYKHKSEHIVLDVSRLRAGQYLVIMKNKDKVKAERLVKE
ncbi:M20/M25/M40 family metallo-hydrolase [uncultured Microscilla sp.]|uniref:M20/M25/M40 family metallo-hydrolase n=1 Tax=uncultured Microscilla sp. TaxID=432653 RepID=UPI00262AAC23|nr:M20/M25/M40 family metallo-hydrolase [uncultured Microscilla sp.]